MKKIIIAFGVFALLIVFVVYSYNLQEQTAWRICSNINPKQVTTSDNKTVLVKEYNDCLMSVSVIDAYKAQLGIDRK